GRLPDVRERLVDALCAGVRPEAAHVQGARGAAEARRLLDRPAGTPGRDHGGAECVAAAGRVDDRLVVRRQRALAVVIENQAAVGTALDDHTMRAELSEAVRCGVYVMIARRR